MVSTKDLRDFFDEATKRAGDAISDAKVPSAVTIGRRDDTPGMLWFGVGLALGAIVGMAVAFLATPYSGEQARQKVSEQVDKVRRRDEMATNGSTYAGTTATRDTLA